MPDRSCPTRQRLLYLILLAIAAVVLSACGSAAGLGADDDEGGGPAAGEPRDDATIRMARATWDTGFMQAEIYRQLLTELDYEVSDPSAATLEPDVFYPALARGEYDFWANGWFPLHEPFFERELLTGQKISEPLTPVGFQIEAGALQGYLIDRKTADEMGITSMTDFTRPDVIAAFDDDGNGRADLLGCNEGWGCNAAIAEHLASLEWGVGVEQIVGQYPDLIADAIAQIDAGEPTLFYTWTPNWTVDVLLPGEDVVWLESPPLPEDEGRTEVDGLEGCAGEQPCQLGWVANDIRVVANEQFLDANPTARTLFEVVEIPLADILDQNAEMHPADDYSAEDVAGDAREWIEENRTRVDAWLDEARAASAEA